MLKVYTILIYAVLRVHRDGVRAPGLAGAPDHRGRAQLEKLCAGQPFEPLRYVEEPSNEPQAYDGSISVSSTWKTSIAVPGAAAPVKCSVLLKNDDPRNDLRARFRIAPA